MSGKYIEVNHPILKHKLTRLRNKETSSPDFRAAMEDISRLLAFEATRDISLEEVDVETPLAKTKGHALKNPPIVVSIMRAGNGMLDAVLSVLPTSRAGHIGIYRDKFIKNTVEYYFKLPEKCKGKDILLVDPLLATADTVIAAIDRLKQYEVGKIKILCILASPQGLERVHHFHPDVDIYALSKEEGLNDNGYILPGLGDAGDRLYNTK